MKKHILQLDYLKSIFIILMILFHLVYIGDTYPYLKKVVYTFHMPIFLVLSGYLSRTDKRVKQFFVSFWWLFLPYSIMEFGYVLVASIIPVREQIGDLSIVNIIRTILIEPVGPYWYLHTLLLCRTVHFTIVRLFQRKVDDFGLLIILGLCFWGISQVAGLIVFSYSMFFWVGVSLRVLNFDFLTWFSPSAWSAVPLVVLCCSPENIGGFNLAGCAIVYLMVSFLLWAYTILPSPVVRVCMHTGKNTLCLLLFSPIFTMLSRMYLPLFMFEPTGICFASFTIVFTIAGCFAITWCMDKLKVSPCFFGQKKMLEI